MAGFIRICMLLTCFAPSMLLAQTNLYFPPTSGTSWETKNPESLGFCAERIDSLYQYLEDHDTKSFILLEDGEIVLEKYFGTYTRDSFWYWASAGKITHGLSGWPGKRRRTTEPE